MLEQGWQQPRHEKSIFTIIVIAIVLLLIGAAAIFILWLQSQPMTTVHLGDGIFITRIARTSTQRGTGLSGTASMRDDQAMLFIFDSERRWPMWMKGMHFPLDIVWLDSNKKVVYIVKNASPDSYPDTSFTPISSAKYVLEVTAGTTTQKMITIGSVAAFDDSDPGNTSS